MPDSVTQILKSGPPGTKLNIAVLGDGFAAGDQDRAAAQAPQGEVQVKQIRLDQPKVGRNDLCPCGSGKKYKKCCGQKA